VKVAKKKFWIRCGERGELRLFTFLLRTSFGMSALRPKVDIATTNRNVRFGSKADFRIIELAASVHRDLRTGHTI
jgi:hypothetical protein